MINPSRNAAAANPEYGRVQARSYQFGRILLAAAGIALALNLLGFVWFAEVAPADGLAEYEVTPQNDRLTPESFWREVRSLESLDDEHKAAGLVSAISRRIVYVNADYFRPTLAENWLIWSFAQWKGHYTWSSPERAVRAGGGYCSQHAVIFQALAERLGLQSRIVTLSGHVLNEVRVAGRWRAVDPTFEVVFDNDIEHLAAAPDEVTLKYERAGQTAQNSARWTQALITLDDNRTEVRVHDYVGLPYLIEKFSFIAVWIVPLVLFAAGFWLTRSRTRSGPRMQG